jgi:hypothetical protein
MAAYGMKFLACLLGTLTLAWAQLPPTPTPSTAEQGGQPKLVVPQRSQDIGAVVEGDKVTVSWTLENRGNADLVIEQTRATCGCTVVKLADEEKVIRPGTPLALKVEFDSTGRFGTQTKSVTVHSNDPTQPTVSLEFTAQVEALYEMKPSGVVNLRAVRRGQAAERSIELLPGPGRKSVKVEQIGLPPDPPVTFDIEPLEAGGRSGQRLRVSVRDDLALGTVVADAKLRLNVDGIVKERVVSVRGDVVGDLAWHPQVIDATRQVTTPGTKLAPLTIRSTDSAPFEIQSAEAGPMFEIAVEPAVGPAGTQYSVSLVLREGATPGPFAATLVIRTSTLDQPVVRVPVFGIAAPPIEVDPPVVVLRQDGSPMGAKRRLKLQALPTRELQVVDIRCSNDAVSVAPSPVASARYAHIRVFDINLARPLPEGNHEAVLKVSTSLPEAKEFEVPVKIIVPPRKG